MASMKCECGSLIPLSEGTVKCEKCGRTYSVKKRGRVWIIK